MKEKAKQKEVESREAEVKAGARTIQLEKERDELERRVKKKSQRYKRRISEMLQELTALTQKNHWIAEEAREKQQAYNSMVARYEQETALFRVENLRKDEVIEKTQKSQGTMLCQIQS